MTGRSSRSGSSLQRRAISEALTAPGQILRFVPAVVATLAAGAVMMLGGYLFHTDGWGIGGLVMTPAAPLITLALALGAWARAPGQVGARKIAARVALSVVMPTSAADLSAARSLLVSVITLPAGAVMALAGYAIAAWNPLLAPPIIVAGGVVITLAFRVSFAAPPIARSDGTGVQTSSPDRQVLTRRMVLDPSFEGMPRHFAEGGDLIQSHLITAMSASFPDGEDFFVRSVRHFRDQVTDPVLKRQVAGFIGQEASHGREHRAFNDRLAELGYPVKFMQRMVKRFVALEWKLLSPLSCLADTVVIEHLTATLAETILTDEAYRRSFGAAENLFVWHALEESEHKAVAFDVYRAVGGSERVRVWAMKLARWGLVLSFPVVLLIGLLFDRATYRRDNLRRSWKRFRSSALIRRTTWERLKDFERPDFHPNDWDNTALVEEWRARLFGEDGQMKQWLSGSAA